ncbi:intraflagellar transport protein 46 homolog [Rhipicephalus sanguineus]|uniref:intraflagellar transport protein 46 homolog n=1 Tax=Rhipicephalus sanguineus TaxID=34632 RepID=UPI00189417F0|nr:intraflagellar transport protein 46 homolog [Rhipicephalus sanguineus]
MPKEEGQSSTKDKAGSGGGKPGLLASMLNPFRKQAKPEAVQGLMAAASSEEGPAHRQAEDEEEDDEEDEAEDEDEDEPVIAVEGSYDPTEFDSLAVSAEIKEIFGFLCRYTPQTVELDQELRPFVPELIPAVGDIDAFLKVPRPDGRADTVQLGLRVLDEPSAQQSDPSILALRLRALSRDARLAATSKAVVKSVEKPEEQPREIELWLQSVQELHRARPPPTVHYTRNMPDVESLMQEWPPDFEEMLAEVQVPTAELECSLEEYATMACLLMDIPVYKGKLIQSLHVLFTLFTAFKNSQHFGAMGIGTGGTGGGGKAAVEDADAEGVDRLVL